MAAGHELGDFLTSRRAALTPEEVGLPVSAETRRVSGLRREEVAVLAGVSVDYYIKFEQGRAPNVSEQIIQAIERTLRLDVVERLHLRTLLHPATSPVTELAGRTARPEPMVLAILESMRYPALLFSPHLDVLGVNAAGKILIDDFSEMPPDERNFVRWMYLNPRARLIYREWESVASQMVGILRCAAIGNDANERLERLLGSLTIASPEFARAWSEYRVRESGSGSKLMYNETVGELRLHFETLRLASQPGQFIMVSSARPGSPDEDKLGLLLSWSAH